MTPVLLPDVIDLSAATRVAETLRAAAGPMILDGSGVERIGIAGLQVLLSAQATAAGSGHPFDIERPSPALRTAMRTAGADFLLVSER